MDNEEKKQLRYKYILITVCVSCIVAVLTASLTFVYCGGKGNRASLFYSLLGKTKILTNSTKSDETIKVIGESLKSFREVIDNYYIGSIDETKMLDGAIKGYVSGLDDEYSEYMTAEEWETYQTAALGNYVGIGIYMGTNEDGNTIVSSPIKDSPAEKAGLKTEDIIAEVNGENALGVDSADIASKIKGPAGTKVKLKVIRDSEYLDFEITRQEIKMYHVESEMLEGNIGYMNLATFDEGCAEELKATLQDLKSKGAQKYILDIRYNTGGLVDEAIEIVNAFLPKDRDVLITVDSDGNRVVTQTQKNNITDADVVVLANQYSASASEILIGALKDNKRATIVGKKTYGKGVIQNVFSLGDGSVLKLTVAEYYTPDGTRINKVGIKPDIELEEAEQGVEDVFITTAIKVLKGEK